MSVVGFTFGSFGDIITLIQLAQTVRKALSDARGSAAHCTSLMTYLDAFTQSLEIVRTRLEPFDGAKGPIYPATSPLRPLEVQVILEHVATCYHVLETFSTTLQPYIKLADSHSAESFLEKVRRAWRKFRYISVQSEAEDVERRLTALTCSITMALQTVQV